MVTARIERGVRLRFDDADAPAVLSALRAWRISYETEPPSERLIAAALFVADGRREGLRESFRLAERDWRDLLVAAGLEHGNWRKVLDRRLGPSE
jgi:hypothetical protein